MEKLKEVKGGILAEGETSGHHHRVGVQVMERPDGIRLFEGATTAVHEEHGKIDLPETQWASDKVNETDHISKMERKVID